MKNYYNFQFRIGKYLSVFLIFLTQIIQAKDIYVSKLGKDSNPGTFERPYLTVSKAASIARAGDVVYIREGVYEETIEPANSGTNGNPIVFKGYQKERVIVTAMQALNGWTSDGDGRWKTTLDWDLGQRNFVMKGTKVLDLARWPNNIDGNRFTLNSLRNDGGSQDEVSRDAFLTDREIPNWNWSKGGSIMFYGDRPGSGWTTWRAWIKSQSSGRVNFDAIKSAGWIISAHPPGDKGDYFLEGIKEALDYENEWFFDTETKTLYVQLPGGVKPGNGEVQMARRPLTANLKSRNYIRIENMALFGGSVQIQGVGNRLKGVKVLYGSMTRGITPNFNSGANAVDVQYGSQNTIIEDSEIAFGDGTGVWNSGDNGIVRNNYVHDFNFLGSYDAPIMSRDGKNAKILRNTVSRGGRDGMQIISKNTEVAYNNVSTSNLIADDCGLIYVIGSDLNIDIHHNWFHDAQGRGKLNKAAGIYLDSGNDSRPDPEKVNVYRNVVWNVEWTAVQMNWNATDINVYNNTLVKAEGGTMGAWHRAGTQFKNVKVWNNITDRESSDRGGNQESEATWEPQSNQQNNLVDRTSFVNFSNNNFRLKNGSKAVDFGRVINGYTDGFKGNAPDVGAYEFGDNWVPGPNWNVNEGPNGICYGLPGESCNASTVTNNDSVSFENPRLRINSKKSYNFDVKYSASVKREVVVEFWSAEGWIAQKSVEVNRGSRTVTIKVDLPSAPKAGSGYVYKTHIRPLGTTWREALDADQVDNVVVRRGQLITNGTYYLESTQVNQRLSARASENHNGKMVNAKGYRREQWLFTHISNNIYTIKNLKSNRFLEVPFAKCEDGSNVATWTDSADSHKRWKIIENGPNNYNLFPQHCDTKALDRANGAINANAQIWDFNANNENQIWGIRSIKASKSIVEEGSEKVQVYPTPFDNEFAIENTNSLLGATVKLINLQGRVVYETTIKEDVMSVQIEANAIESGMYFMHLVSDQKMAIKKIIKK